MQHSVLFDEIPQKRAQGQFTGLSGVWPRPLCVCFNQKRHQTHHVNTPNRLHLLSMRTNDTQNHIRTE